MKKQVVYSRFTEDTLQSYFNQIKHIPLLSFEEELELSQKIMKGDEAAKKRLIESNLRLVVKIAKAYVTPDVSLLDIVQEGNLGLLKAAAKYDYRKQVRFSTYAAWWIKQAIVRSLSNKRRTIRLPHRKEETIKRIQKTFTTLSQKLLRKPSIHEIAGELNMVENDIVDLLMVSNSVVSLETEPGVDSSGTLMDVYEDFSYEPQRQLMDKNMREETMRFLEKLLEREKRILLYRFSFFGNKKYTLKTIGEKMGISPETVRQIEKRALKKLKNHISEIQEYVYS
ncbi:MAG: RNA polymerase sigma factor RpoD/SigA [Spirochaetales bacterium]|nr:MAG: RNA polymerase sigma factor RpoD/SigA [Spirochaetales bacterium]